MFDYIIVGAGSAGCVLAHRLTTPPDVKVLLLEAGGSDTRPGMSVPAAFSRLFKTDVDWAYQTEPQADLLGRSLYWPRGKVIGGSSSINAMIYIRGNRCDYDRWAEDGCEGWSFNDVLPRFRKSEDHVLGPSHYHGTGGPMRVEEQRDPNALSRVFVQACAQLGIPPNGDFNGPEQDGAGLYHVTQRGGRRESAATAFLRPALARKNLTVETEALVTRVLIKSGRAVGVEYRRGGQNRTAEASTEVVLCGGSINSPQLLMLSGVGPAEHLRENGIDVGVDSREVGANLQDHPIVGVRYRSRQAGTLLSAESLMNLTRYLLLRRGMLTSNVAEAGAFVRTDDAGVPNLQFHVAPVLFSQHGLERPTEHGFSLGPTLVRPRSRGAVRLRTADPHTSPAIDPAYLSEPQDLSVLVDGVRLARDIVAQAAYAPYRGEELTPGPNVKSTSQISNYVKETLETLYHPVGTCRMGADADAVVDPQLRVRGVDGLRVADASVMPQIVNGNTHAPTVMIAEMAAEMILESAGLQAEPVTRQASS